MNHKAILASLLTIGVAATMLGVGTMAYFSDTEESTGNTFTAGTIDLRLSDDNETLANGVTATWSVPNWAPGDEHEAVLIFTNVGTTGAKMLRIKGLGLSESVDHYADNIEITKIYYSEMGHYMPTDGEPWNLVGYYATIFGDGVAPLTLREFVETPYSMVFWIGDHPPITDYLPAGSARSEKLMLGFHFMDEAGNEFQGASASFTLRAMADDDTAILGKGNGCYGY